MTGIPLWFDGLNRLLWALHRDDGGFLPEHELQYSDGALHAGDTIHVPVMLTVTDLAGDALPATLDLRSPTFIFEVPWDWARQHAEQGAVRLIPKTSIGEVLRWRAEVRRARAQARRRHGRV